MYRNAVAFMAFISGSPKPNPRYWQNRQRVDQHRVAWISDPRLEQSPIPHCMNRNNPIPSSCLLAFFVATNCLPDPSSSVVLTQTIPSLPRPFPSSPSILENRHSVDQKAHPHPDTGKTHSLLTNSRPLCPKPHILNPEPRALTTRSRPATPPPTPHSNQTF